MPRCLPSLLRSTEANEEDAFRQYLDPEVSLKIAALYALTAFAILVSPASRGVDLILFRITPFLFLVFAAVQCLFALMFRRTKDTKWLFASDVLLMSFKFWLSVVSDEVTRDIRSQECPAVDSVIYRRESSGPYRVANCERLLRSHDVLTTVVMVALRQRFAHLFGSSVLAVGWLLLMVPLRASNDINPALRWFEIIFVAGVVSLCSYVRYLLEVNDRVQFKTQEELKQYHTELRAKSEELTAELKAILPPKVLERSANSKKMLHADNGDDVVVLQAGLHDVNGLSRSLTPFDVAKAVGEFHVLAFELAELTKSLQRIHVLHDECLIVGNLLCRAASPSSSLHEACWVALKLCTGSPRTVVAAVHAGEATGAFTGTRFIRYDVRGRAVDTCDRVMQLCGPNEVLVTGAVVHLLHDAIAVREKDKISNDNNSDGIYTFLLESVQEADQHSDAVVSSGSAGLTHADDSSSATGNTEMGGSETRSAFDVGAAAQVAHDSARVGAEGDDDDDGLERIWCFFSKFTDETTEGEYLQERTVRLLRRASAVWLAYATFLLLTFVLLLADFFETRLASAAVVLLTICILSAVGVSVVGAKLRDNPVRRWHLVWSSCAVLVPLGVVISLAMARPSIVGNEVISFIMIGALMRSPLIVVARHQLVVVPSFLALAQLQLLFPGALLRAAAIWAALFVLFTITSDARQDRVERHHFVNKKRIIEALELLAQERKLREGLVRSQLPGPLWEAISTGKFGAGVVECRRISDTIAVVVTLSDAATSRSQAARLLSFVEDLERRAPQLHVAKIVGSVAIMTNVIMNGGELDGDNMEASTLSVLLQLTEEEAKCAVLVDIDSVIQRVSTAGLPSFEMLGPAIGRLLSLRATGSFASGTYVTDRVLANVRRSGMQEMGQTLMPPVRIRGVGIVRMTKVSSAGL